MSNPIRKVLSTLSSHRVEHLLMGGQACIVYGAAEFSRDTDIAIHASADNLGRLTAALAELQATCIALPPFTLDYLQRGHAVHFRCAHPDAAGMRIDVLAVLRGVADFANLWARRTSLEIEPGLIIDVMSLADLVRAKKTHRDKDWPMIRRLVEGHYVQHKGHPLPEQVRFWLREGRTPSMLLEVARSHPELTVELAAVRPLLQLVAAGNLPALEEALADEERQEREADRAYWQPLKGELEQLRHRGGGGRAHGASPEN